MHRAVVDEVPVVTSVMDGIDTAAGDASSQAVTNLYGVSSTLKGDVPLYRYDVTLRLKGTEEVVREMNLVACLLAEFGWDSYCI